MSGKVVVFVTPQFGKHRQRPYVVAQFPELGLSAYGKDRDAALKDLKALLREFIELSRESGILEDRLQKAGVKWMTVDAAQVRGITYEDLSPNLASSEFERLMLDSVIEWESTRLEAGEEHDLLIAA